MTKKLVYLMAATGSIGASVFSIEIVGIQLSIFRGIVILLSFFMVVELLLLKKSISLRKITGNRYSLVFMIIWLFYALLTLVWVKDYESWIKSIYFLTLGLLSIIIFIRYIKTSNEILKVFKIMSSMTYIHNIIGWYEIIEGKYLFLQNSQEIYAFYKYPVSMFGNTNNFATYMLFSVFILYLNAANTKQIFVKLINWGFIFSSIYLIIMTNSRANLLALFMAIAAFIFMLMKNKKSRRNLLIVFIIGFIVIFTKPSFLINLFTVIDTNLSFRFSAPNSSDSTRFNLIKNGIHFLISTLGFGTGAGNIEFWMSNYSKYYVHDVKNIHNWWLEILVGYGCIIFIMYVKFYMGLICSMYKKQKYGRNKIDKTISVTIISCMIGYIIGSISSSSNISSEWLWVFWATAISYQGIKINNTQIPKQEYLISL